MFSDLKFYIVRCLLNDYDKQLTNILIANEQPSLSLPNSIRKLLSKDKITSPFLYKDIGMAIR
ncbi:hypothetical protein SAMD00019534_102770 [Acytostelium subglobosum LB1]|uniref:hypothetical protein n=1 Tax=Acytostelium subglobosum LB1 TaxID=1410327 RepID=UPI000644EB80|nr:hypothetical protein SAMD00019534_102770 [Acytostelium subglobosum LB1]GAM27102.1 hypothetical protein SAMD00019534_102770 [Acytostelium subglobosum LB1]|eukprot:XP_012749982.1 hypothetical protein SAMD00019534_102770 [Acytostelium subglobosum LB1]